MENQKLDALNMLVAIAEKEVGVRETVGENNTGERITLYQEATWLLPGPWSWCAAFTCWVLREWVHTPHVKEVLQLTSYNACEKWRCKDARAFGWEEWAVKRKLRVLPETQLAKKGDIVVFDFSHIGIVIEDQKSIKTSIKTIEGNTNGAGERDSVKGDGVWKKSRAPSLTKSYIRLL